jgi:hypothetical protein
MDIVDRIASYAKAVPAGLRAAGQELAKTASAVTSGEPPAPPAPSSRRPRKKTTARRAPAKRTTANRAKKKPAKAKRPAPGKKRKARR